MSNSLGRVFFLFYFDTTTAKHLYDQPAIQQKINVCTMFKLLAAMFVGFIKGEDADRQWLLTKPVPMVTSFEMIWKLTCPFWHISSVSSRIPNIHQVTKKFKISPLGSQVKFVGCTSNALLTFTRWTAVNFNLRKTDWNIEQSDMCIRKDTGGGHWMPIYVMKTYGCAFTSRSPSESFYLLCWFHLL